MNHVVSFNEIKITMKKPKNHSEFFCKISDKKRRNTY